MSWRADRLRWRSTFRHTPAKTEPARWSRTACSRAELARTLVIAVLIAALFGGWSGLLAALAGIAAAAFLHWRIASRLGGYTGDTLGAMEQVCEIAILVVLAAMWSVS